jgi:hypothetical protein
MADKLGIQVEVGFEEYSKVDAKAKQLLKQLQANNKLDLMVDFNIGNIVGQMNQMFSQFNANSHQMGHNMISEMDNVQHKIEKVFRDSKVSGEGYKDLQQRVNEIKIATDEYAKVTIQTYKNTKNLKSAVIEYTDSTGKAVKETMQWTEYLDKANNISKKIFQTTGYTFVDNIAKANKETQKQIELQNKLIEKEQTQLNLIRMQYSEKINGLRQSGLVPEDKISAFEANVNNMSSTGALVKEDLKQQYNSLIALQNKLNKEKKKRYY